jgi:hypothetical protein
LVAFSGRYVGKFVGPLVSDQELPAVAHSMAFAFLFLTWASSTGPFKWTFAILATASSVLGIGSAAVRPRCPGAPLVPWLGFLLAVDVTVPIIFLLYCAWVRRGSAPARPAAAAAPSEAPSPRGEDPAPLAGREPIEEEEEDHDEPPPPNGHASWRPRAAIGPPSGQLPV